MPSIVTRPGIVRELCPELLGNGRVLRKLAVPPICLIQGERFSGDVLGDPIRIASLEVHQSDLRGVGGEGGEGTGIRIVEDSGWIYG